MKRSLHIFKKLGFQFGLVLVFLTTTPVLIIAIELIGINKTGIESATMELFSSTAELAASEVDHFAMEKLKLTKDLASPFSLQEDSIYYGAIEKMKDSFGRYPSLLAVGVYDENGIEIFTLEREGSPGNLETLNINMVAVENVISGNNVVYFRSNPTLQFIVYTAFNPENIIVTVHDANELTQTLDRHRFGRSGAACLIDGEGRGLYKAESDNLPVNLADYDNEAQLLGLVKNHTYGASDGISEDGRRVLLAFFPTNNTEGGVIIHQLFDDAYYSSNTIRRASIIGVIIVGIIAVAAAVVFSTYLSRPIRKLAVAARKLAEGDFDTRVESKRSDEMGDLVNIFNETVVSLKEKVIIESAMRRYLSEDMTDYIIERPEMLQLGGEERTISTMFVDIRNFVSYSSDMTPKELVSFLNYQHDVITKIVFKHHGTLDKFVGDGLIALFGAPLILDDYPGLAVGAAREIQQTIENDSALKSSGISICTGKVVVGNLGSLQRMEYTAVGYPMNLASRLENYAGPGEIVIDDTTYREIAAFADVAGPFQENVRGFSEPITFYKVKSFSGDEYDQQ